MFMFRRKGKERLRNGHSLICGLEKKIKIIDVTSSVIHT